MTVFKAFFKVLNKCKVVVITYTIFLIFFGAFNMQTSDNSVNFVASKPDILIINQDSNEKITKNLLEYIQKNSNIVNIKNDEQSINDALFYRDVNYIIYVPKNYSKDFLEGKNPKIQIKSTGDYQSSLADMLLTRYINVANTYLKQIQSEDDLINKINETLEKQTYVEITSKLDTDHLSKVAFFYNFSSYSILAGCVYVICLILSTFNIEKIKKRTIISSMNYKEHNLKLFLANCLFAFLLWIIYVLLSFVLIGNIMFTIHGIIYIINSFIFTICAVAIAFLIGNLVTNKNTINGIVNVVALGSSFLCGAFVPMEWLPNTVLKIAHILPSYYYIKNNEILKTLEILNLKTLEPVFFNILIILIFTFMFIIITNIVAKRKRKVG